jgi:hypothetical protein
MALAGAIPDLRLRAQIRDQYTTSAGLAKSAGQVGQVERARLRCVSMPLAAELLGCWPTAVPFCGPTSGATADRMQGRPIASLSRRATPASPFGLRKAAARAYLFGLARTWRRLRTAIRDGQSSKAGVYSSHTCPGRNARKRSGGISAACKASARAMRGASNGSSVSWKVP